MRGAEGHGGTKQEKNTTSFLVCVLFFCFTFLRERIKMKMRTELCLICDKVLAQQTSCRWLSLSKQVDELIKIQVKIHELIH